MTTFKNDTKCYISLDTIYALSISENNTPPPKKNNKKRNFKENKYLIDFCRFIHNNDNSKD